MLRSACITRSVEQIAVAQPIGDVLAGDTQRGAVFHQCDVVVVRYFRAADPGIDPTHA